MRSTAAVLAMVLLPSVAAAEGNPAAGERAFGRCTSCHSVEPGQNEVGPSLAGVVGRRSGSAAGFNYSPAMRDAGVVWDESTLDRFLQNPAGFLPGSRMFIALRNVEERQNIIAYLETLSR